MFLRRFEHGPFLSRLWHAKTRRPRKLELPLRRIKHRPFLPRLRQTESIKNFFAENKLAKIKKIS
jgi:hypothetical protein